MWLWTVKRHADGLFTRNRNGHGLGLAIVKAIAILHEANVSAANRAGGGAELTLSFFR